MLSKVRRGGWGLPSLRALYKITIGNSLQMETRKNPSTDPKIIFLEIKFLEVFFHKILFFCYNEARMYIFEYFIVDLMSRFCAAYSSEICATFLVGVVAL